MSVVSEHSWQAPDGERTYRVAHADERCSYFRKAEIVERDVPITSGSAGLPCSYCVVLPPCRSASLEDVLRRLVAEHRPDVDFDAHKADLVARGDWSIYRIARAIRRIEAEVPLDPAAPVD